MAIPEAAAKLADVFANARTQIQDMRKKRDACDVAERLEKLTSYFVEVDQEEIERAEKSLLEDGSGNKLCGLSPQGAETARRLRAQDNNDDRI